MFDKAAGQSARRWFLALVATHVVVWTLLPTLTFPNAPLDVVENAVWGRDFAWGYAKHPPLLFWLVDLVLRAGDTAADWPLYLIAQLAIAIALWATWKLANSVLDPAGALVAVLLAECSLYYTWVSTELNQNVLSVPFFAPGTWFFYRALTDTATKWWLALGASLGLGALTKYTIGLLVVSVGLFILCDARARRTLRTSGPWLALLTMIAIFAPHAIWMVRHEFVTLQYASGRAANHRGLAGHIVHPLVFAGGQLLHAGLPLLAATLLLIKSSSRVEWMTGVDSTAASCSRCAVPARVAIALDHAHTPRRRRPRAGPRSRECDHCAGTHAGGSIVERAWRSPAISRTGARR